MGAFRVLTVPIRRIANSRLFQLVVVIAVVLLLENFSSTHPLLGQMADGLDKLVETTVQVISEHFLRLRTFTKSMLTDSVMIGYVYLACLVAFALVRWLLTLVLDLTGRTNFLWLRKTIARERGIAAYRAWVPLERIRPSDYPQSVWEEEFAWPAGDRPPYPPLGARIVRSAVGYAAVLAGAAVLLQFFTTYPVLTWIEKLIS
jgi:hypothetical protein